MRKPYVFLSHNSADKPQVIRLARALMSEGVRVWLDVFELRPRDWFGSKITRALEGAEVVLGCVGEHGKGPWHDRELAAAGAKVVVVALPGWKGKELLGKDMQVAWNLNDWEAKFPKLVDALPSQASNGTMVEAADGGPFDGCPYPGIDDAFNAEHAAWFFGREDKTAEIIRRLQRHRWVWLVGNSGSGKSSVARAGVMAWWPRALKGRGRTTVFSPSSEPKLDYAAALAGLSTKQKTISKEAIAADLNAAKLELRAAFGDEPRPPPILVVIDQAEQMFAAGAGLRPGCAEVLAALNTLTCDDGLDVRVLVVLRTDWLQRALEAKLIAVDAETQLSLTELDEPALRAAIEIPARRAGGGVQGAVIAQLLYQVARHAHGLPLLQFVLQTAWHEAGPNKEITVDVLGVQPFEKAIGEHVRKMEIEPSDEQMDRLAELLVELDDRDALRRRVVSRAEIEAHPEMASLLDALTRARVLTVTGASMSLAHEAVLSAWEALAAAIDRRRSVLKDIATLARRAADGFLLEAEAIDRFRPLLAQRLAPPVEAFLRRSIAAHEERAARAREQYARLLLASAGAHRDPLVRALLYAEISDSCADLLVTHLARTPLHFVPRARRVDLFEPVARWSPDGKHVLIREQRNGFEIWPADLTGEPIFRATEGSISVDWHPSGTCVVTSHPDGLWLWPLDAAEPGTRLPGWDAISGHLDQPVTEWAWSPDGEVLVLATVGGGLLLVDCRGDRPPLRLTGMGRPIATIAWQPSGDSFFTHHRDQTVAIWRRDGEVLAGEDDVSAISWLSGWRAPIYAKGRELFGAAPFPESLIHDADVMSIAVNRAGTLLLTTTYDGGVHIWEVDGTHIVLADGGPQQQICTAAWSRDDAILYVDLQRVCIWSASPFTLPRWSWTEAPLLEPSPSEPAPLVARSRGGRVAWVDGRDVCVGAVERGPVSATTSHFVGEFRALAWRPDGIALAVATDYAVHLWDLFGNPSLIVTGPASLLAWRPHGRCLAVATESGVLVVEDGALRFKLPVEGRAVRMTWSADGSTLHIEGPFYPVAWIHDGPTALAALRGATTATLTPAERMEILGEDEATARAAFEAKERQHGRLSPSASTR